MTTTKNYDTLNRLTSIFSTDAQLPSPISYVYAYHTANPHTRATLSDGSYWINYDGWNMVYRIDALATDARFVWGWDLSGTEQGAGGVGGLLWMRAGPAPQLAAYDGNGNVVALVRATSGELYAQYEYGPFGELIRRNGAMAETNPFRFSTKYQDDETDLLYYGYRYYDPSTGRWPNRDPVEEDGGEALYGFVRNDAVSRADRLGLFPFIPPGGNLNDPWPSDRPCCNNPCSKQDEGMRRFLLAIPVTYPGNMGPNDEDLIELQAKRLRRLLWVCRGRAGYLKEEAKLTINAVEALAKKKRVEVEGVNMHTIAVYEVCRKKKCKIFGKCAEYHWVKFTSDPRPCKPTWAESHQAYPDRFDEGAVDHAEPRCKREHESEFNEH